MQRQRECFTPTSPSNDQSQTNNSHQPKVPVTSTGGGCGGKSPLQTLMAPELSPRRWEMALSSPGGAPAAPPSLAPTCCGQVPEMERCCGAGDGAGSLPAGPCIMLGFALMVDQPCCPLAAPAPLCLGLWGSGWVQMGGKFYYSKWTRLSLEVRA